MRTRRTEKAKMKKRAMLGGWRGAVILTAGVLCIAAMLAGALLTNFPLRQASTKEATLICGQTEHTHTEDCYDADGQLTCGLDEHVHNADCYAQAEKALETPPPTPTPEPTRVAAQFVATLEQSAPQPEEPAAAEPQATQVPVTEGPVTQAPATEAPVTQVPVTQVPATEAPVTQVPVTQVPVTQIPVTEVPMTEAPAITQTPAPVTPEPAVETPAPAPTPVALVLDGLSPDRAAAVAGETIVWHFNISGATSVAYGISNQKGESFAGGSLADERSISFTAPSGGVYTFTLAAQGENGQQQVIASAVTVAAADELIASVTSSMRYAFAYDDTLVFDTAIQGGTAPYMVTYQVEVGGNVAYTVDGIQSSIGYVPTQYGVHTLHMHVTDALGATASARYSVPVAEHTDERRTDWEKRFEKIELTGDFARDILTIAYTQLGYKESTTDFIIDANGDMQGYTRFGRWYGYGYAEYSEWCAMFVSFAASYAKIPAEYIPREADTGLFIRGSGDLYVDAATGYVPAPGDLIFFNYEGGTNPQHMGIVTELKNDVVKVISGNSDKMVRENDYLLFDERIIGYVDMGKAMARYAAANLTGQPSEEPTAEPTAEPTSEPTAEPTAEPTGEPTLEPTAQPTIEPTVEPTAEPTAQPTDELPGLTAVCGLEEHAHDENCYDAEGHLTCDLIEHVHTEACFDEGAAPTDAPAQTPDLRTAICGLEEHAHNEDCYDAQGNLICDLIEHVHTEACFEEAAVEPTPEPSEGPLADTSADLEGPADWQNAVAGVSLSNDWAQDLLNIARTQLGYRQSELNFIADEMGSLNHYSRYGAWYGTPYAADWSTQFIAFVMNYAGITDVPTAANAAEWMESLRAYGMFRWVNDYTAQPGDWMLLDLSGDGIADHAAIVEAAEGNVTVIEGGVNGEVARNIYAANDARILGYGSVALAREYYDVLSRMREPITSLPGYEYAMRAIGDGYIVIVGYNSDSGIPQNANLFVSEYLPGSSEYEMRYQQVQQTLAERSALNNPQTAQDETGSLPTPAFARVFNVEIQVDGVEIEPKSAVMVQFFFDDEPQAEDSSVLHFAKEGTELLEGDAVSTAVAEDGTSQVEFALNSFSDLVIFAGEIQPLAALTSGSASISFEPTKQIDWLGDGVTNPDTTLSGEDFYRLYLDTLPKGAPIDLVVVVDRSASMNYNVASDNADGSGLKRDDAVRNLLNGTGGQDGFIKRFLNLHAQNYLSIVWFGGESKSPQQTAFANVTDSGIVTGWIQNQNYTVGDGTASANNVGARDNNGTNYMAGLWAAADMLRSNTAIANNGHVKMVVFLSDGAPTFYVTRSSSNSTTATYANYLSWKTNNTNPALYRRGDGTSSSSNLTANRAPATTAFDDFMTNNPDVVFSTIMFAPSTADATVANSMKANGGKTKHTAGSANLDEVFAEMVGSIIAAKNFLIEDNLSKYVSLYTTLPNLKVQRVNILSGVTQVLWQSSGAFTPANVGTAKTIGAATTANVESGTTIISGVTYTAATPGNSTGLIKVTFNTNYPVDLQWKYSVSFNVQTTAAAYTEFAATGYNATGDANTDYAANQTSSGKAGFRSNYLAQLTYKTTTPVQDVTLPYPHPVVQVRVKDITIEKKVTPEVYAPLYSDTAFSYLLYVEKGIGTNQYELYSGTGYKNGTTAITISNGVFTLKPNETMVVKNLLATRKYYVEETGVSGATFDSVVVTGTVGTTVTTETTKTLTETETVTVASAQKAVQDHPKITFTNNVRVKKGLQIIKDWGVGVTAPASGSITFTLSAQFEDGASVPGLSLASSYTLSPSTTPAWQLTLPDLPTKVGTRKIVYTLTETSMPEGYRFVEVVTDDTANPVKLTVKNVPDTKDIDIEKFWQDVYGNPRTAGLPDSVQVTLRRKIGTPSSGGGGGGSSGGNRTIDFSLYVVKSWYPKEFEWVSVTLTQLQASAASWGLTVDSNGRLIIPDGGTIEFYAYRNYGGGMGQSFPYINATNGGKLADTKKTYLTSENLAAPIYRLSEIATNITLKLSFDETYTQPAGNMGTLIFVITSYTPPSSSGVPATPTETTLTVDPNFTQTVTLLKSKSWKETVTGLQAYDTSGNPYYYYLADETSVPGFTTIFGPENADGIEAGTGGKLTLTNKSTPYSIPVEKKWYGEPPAGTSITINLYENNTLKTNLILNAGNSWKGTFAGLEPTFTYRVEEAAITGYTPVVTSDGRGGYLITNTKLIKLAVNKAWEDGADHTTTGPSIKIKLLKKMHGSADFVDTGTFVTLTPGNWTHIFENLPQYDESGNEIFYAVSEEPVNGYVSVVSEPIRDEQGNYSFTITNTPSYTIVVEKRDTSGSGTKLKDVAFELYREAKDSDTGTTTIQGVTEAVVKVNGTYTTNNNGRITLEGLNPGKYWLVETDVPGGYMQPIGPFGFILNANGSITILDGNTMMALPGTSDSNIALILKNQKGAELPATGGPGNSLDTWLGMAFVMLAGLMYIAGRSAKRRKEGKCF